MNIVNKKIPSLVDRDVLNEIIKHNQIQTSIQNINTTPSQMTKSLISIKNISINYLYKYGHILVIFIGIIVYLWYRYNWYQSFKLENESITVALEQNNTPEQQTQQIPEQRQVIYSEPRIMPRPIPMYNNDINDEIRSIYLDKVDPPQIDYDLIPPTQVPMSNNKYINTYTEDGRLDNVFGQPIYNVEDIQPFSGESFYATA